MRELRAILQNRERAVCEGAAMATVVHVVGSAYRRPGARMLMLADGERIGGISGGCLEADVCERARNVMATGEPAVVTYDSRSTDDLIFGTGLGCEGAITVLIERVTAENSGYLAFMADCFAARRTGIVATLFRVKGAIEGQVGDRLTVSGNAVGGSLADSPLAKSIRLHAADVSRTGRAAIVTIESAAGTADVLLEPIVPPLALLVCGAGQDAIPLVECAALLGWQVTVADHRAATLTPERFSNADRLLAVHPECLAESFVPDTRTAAVIMSHHYTHDLELLRTLLVSSAPYVGLLGPRRRAERLLNDLRQDGFVPDETMRSRLHSPIGLDLGSETPEEIALSIVAEIQAAMAQGSGAALRDRREPLHAPTATLTANEEVIPCRQ